MWEQGCFFIAWKQKKKKPFDQGRTAEFIPTFLYLCTGDSSDWDFPGICQLWSAADIFGPNSIINRLIVIKFDRNSADCKDPLCSQVKLVCSTVNAVLSRSLSMPPPPQGFTAAGLSDQEWVWKSRYQCPRTHLWPPISRKLSLYRWFFKFKCL